jgi:hypothetical protein
MVLLLVGALAGFGVGYKVGDNGGKSTVNATAGKKLTPAQVEFNQLLGCMAARGVKYPKTAGRPKINQAPPGVDHKTYSKALVGCLRSNAGSVPATASKKP